MAILDEIRMKNNLSFLSPPVWLLFVLAGFPQLSETVYSPALPNIAHNLATSNQLVQWTLSIYLLGFALGVFLWGRISDQLGRRPTMLIGISIYILGSLACLMADNIVWLLLARLMQGLGAGAGSVLTQTIARESLQGEQRHRFFSMAGFAMALSIALGPFIGGYLTQWFDWRANFSFLLLLGISIFILVSMCLPETHNKSSAQKVSLTEVFKVLLKDKYVVGCIWLVAAVNGVLFSYYAEAPFIFIQIIHLTSSQYGWLGSTIALAALLGSMASKRLVKYFLPSQLIAFGAIIMLISSTLLVMTSLSNLISSHDKILSVILILGPMMGLVLGGFGFVIPMTLSTALQKHQNVLGTAGALFGLSYYIIMALLTWIMGLIHNGTLLPMPIFFLVISAISYLVYFGLIRDKPN